MRPQELNLLMVFDAIMTEGSVTRAADRLAMTQPAVSNAVSRMRVAWKDDLFIKDGRKIKPTLYARNLWEQINSPLRELNQAVAPLHFDPASADRTFRVSAADGIVDLAWGPMRKLVESEAPGISLHAVPYNIVNGEHLLHDASVDLVLAAMNLMPASLTSLYVYESSYVCVMRPGHPLTKGRLTLKRFADADHLLVSLSGDTVGFTDHELAQKNLRRRIALTVNNFASAPKALIDSDLIAMLPSITVEREILSGELAVRPSPIPLPQTRIGAFWHKRQERDPGLQWLRENLIDILKQRVAEHEAVLAKLCH